MTLISQSLTMAASSITPKIKCNCLTMWAMFKHSPEFKSLMAGGPGSGRKPSSLLKEQGFKGKFERYSGQAGRMYKYSHSDGSSYKINHNVDEKGAPTTVKSWSYNGKGGRAKGTDQQSFEQHLASRGGMKADMQQGKFSDGGESVRFGNLNSKQIKQQSDKEIEAEIKKLEAKSPPGWGGTVKHMKEHTDIDNPFALAWYMKNKGYKSHVKDDK